MRFLGTPEDTTLIMNKNLSTPYNCAQRKKPLISVECLVYYLLNSIFLDLSETHCQNSALALVDNKFPWDMHRPLPDSCTLQLLHFKMAEPQIVNKVFWRSCSYLLGAVLQQTFKDEVGCLLHSFPNANGNIKSS